MRIEWSTGTIFLLCCLVAGAPCQTTPAPLTGQSGSTPSQTAGTLPSEGSPQAVPSTDAGAPDVEALRQLESNYMRAEMEGSAKIAGTILADDYLGIRGDGTAMDKTEVLNNLGRYSRTREPYNITATNMREHVFGDMACVTYTKTYTLPANQASYSENLLHVFTKRNGVWHLQMSSPMQTPRPRGATKPNVQP